MCLPCQFLARGAGGIPTIIFRPQNKICQRGRQEISQGNIEILLNSVGNPEIGNDHSQAATMYYICNKTFYIEICLSKTPAPKNQFWPTLG